MDIYIIHIIKMYQIKYNLKHKLYIKYYYTFSICSNINLLFIIYKNNRTNK